MRKQHCMAWHKVFGLLWGLLLLIGFSSAQAVDKQVIGWLEYAHINEANIRLRVKIDTGADFSSLKAKILKTFNHNGEDWVRFRLRDGHNDAVVLERKIIRYARIKRKMAPSIKRPVVMLGVCIGNIYREVEVNLAKRKKFKYEMLIGRNYLHDVYLVDSARRYTAGPSCPGIKGD